MLPGNYQKIGKCITKYKYYKRGSFNNIFLQNFFLNTYWGVLYVIFKIYVFDYNCF